MWSFQNKPLDESDIPDWAIGFIYQIEQVSTGKKYIGKKLLTKAAYKMVKGKRKKVRKKSDWETYWSSSPELKALIKEVGIKDFTREVLVFCSTKGSLLYLEELALYSVGALENDKWFNNNIRSKVYRNWVKPSEAQSLRECLSANKNVG